LIMALLLSKGSTGKNAAPSHNFRRLPCTCSRDMMRLAEDFAMVTIDHLIDDQSCTVYP
jgi:hypothetical protein